MLDDTVNLTPLTVEGALPREIEQPRPDARARRELAQDEHRALDALGART